MKEKLFLIIVLYIITGAAVIIVNANNIKVVVNPYVNFTAVPVMIKNEPYIPVKSVLEALGWKISWDSKNKTVSAVNGDNKLAMKIGSTNAVLNGESIILDNPPAAIKGISYVSSRFIALEFGTKVRWNKKDNLIIVSNNSTYNINVSGNGNIVIAGEGIIVNIFEPYGIDTVFDMIDDADKLLNAKKPEEAISKYKKIIDNINEKENLHLYSQVMNNMGNAYSMLAQFKDTAKNTQYAVAAYNKALKTYSSDKNNYYITLNNLGNAYLNSWEKTGKNDDLQSAANAYEKILKSGCWDEAGIEGALLDFNIGTAFYGLGKNELAVESLKKAQNIYETLLKDVSDDQKNHEMWALLQYNLGNVCKSLSLITDKENNAKNAESAYEKALTIMTVESCPLEYAQIHKYLGDIYKLLSSLADKREYTLRAIEEYTESLKIYTPDEYPVCNKQVNLELESIIH